MDVKEDAIFVRDGAVWTSAGVTAGIDLALALVQEDHGREVAMRIARQLVVFMKRPGGQSQFSAMLDAEDVVELQSDLRFFIGPSNALHIDQISIDDHRGREAGKKVPIDVPLHGGVRGLEVVSGGCNFQVYDRARTLIERQRAERSRSETRARSRDIIQHIPAHVIRWRPKSVGFPAYCLSKSTRQFPSTT